MVQSSAGKLQYLANAQRAESSRDRAAAVEAQVQVRLQVIHEFGFHRDRLNRLVKCSIDCVDILDEAQGLREMLDDGLQPGELRTVATGMQRLAMKLGRVVQQIERSDARHDEVEQLHKEVAAAADSVDQLRRQATPSDSAHSQVEHQARYCVDDTIKLLRVVSNEQLREAENVLDELGGRIKEVTGSVVVGGQERESTAGKSGALGDIGAAKPETSKSRGLFGRWAENKGAKSG